MSEVSEDLRLQYERTDYCAKTPRGELTLRVGEHSTTLDELLVDYDATTWAYLTAWNPRSEQRELSANQSDQEKLLTELKSAGITTFTGQGASHDGQWEPEPSILALGITLARAREIAHRYNQNAILYGVLGGEPELLFLR